MRSKGRGSRLAAAGLALALPRSLRAERLKGSAEAKHRRRDERTGEHERVVQSARHGSSASARGRARGPPPRGRLRSLGSWSGIRSHAVALVQHEGESRDARADALAVPRGPLPSRRLTWAPRAAFVDAIGTSANLRPSPTRGAPARRVLRGEASGGTTRERPTVAGKEHPPPSKQSSPRASEPRSTRARWQPRVSSRAPTRAFSRFEHGGMTLYPGFDTGG